MKIERKILRQRSIKYCTNKRTKSKNRPTFSGRVTIRSMAASVLRILLRFSEWNAGKLSQRERVREERISPIPRKFLRAARSKRRLGGKTCFRKRKKMKRCFPKSTYDDHLGGLENEALVGSPRAATRPLPKAATENASGAVKISSPRERELSPDVLFTNGELRFFFIKSRKSRKLRMFRVSLVSTLLTMLWKWFDDCEKWVVSFFCNDCSPYRAVSGFFLYNSSFIV